MTIASDTVFAAPGSVTGYAAIAVAALMLAVWLVSIPLRDVSIVDPAWGPAFVLVSLVAAVAGDGSSPSPTPAWRRRGLKPAAARRRQPRPLHRGVQHSSRMDEVGVSHRVILRA